MNFILLTAKNDEGIQDIAVQATTRLKQVLTNEREVKMRLQDEVENLKVISFLSRGFRGI